MGVTEAYLIKPFLQPYMHFPSGNSNRIEPYQHKSRGDRVLAFKRYKINLDPFLFDTIIRQTVTRTHAAIMRRSNDDADGWRCWRRWRFKSIRTQVSFHPHLHLQRTVSCGLHHSHSEVSMTCFLCSIVRFLFTCSGQVPLMCTDTELAIWVVYLHDQ